jgi:hypothetical protein
MQARQTTINSCLSLVGRYGITAEDCNQVRNAFAAVGIGEPADELNPIPDDENEQFPGLEDFIRQLINDLQRRAREYIDNLIGEIRRQIEAEIARFIAELEAEIKKGIERLIAYLIQQMIQAIYETIRRACLGPVTPVSLLAFGWVVCWRRRPS